MEEIKKTQETEEKTEISEAPKRKRRSVRRKQRNLVIALVIAILAAVVVVINLPYFNVENISVIGNKRVEDAEVKRLSEMEDEKSIIGLNSLLAARKIKVNPYIENVRIRRELPSTIKIIVKEKDPAAQLATAKEKNKKRRYVVIDSEGEVLEISEKKLDMTFIKDVDASKAKLREKVEVSDEAAYEKAMQLIATASANDMYFMRISIKGSWVDSCIYDDLYCRGRYDNIESALKEGTLRTVVYRLYQQNVNKGTINVADNNYCSFTDKT